MERIHCSIKASLWACSASNWQEDMPLVCLGLRSAPREDSNISAAKRVFGLPLCLPGPLLNLPDIKDQPLAHRFKQMMAGVPLQPLVQTDGKQLPPDMAWAYLRVDRHKPALAQLYEGPHCVLQQTRNTTLLQMGAKTEKVNLEGHSL